MLQVLDIRCYLRIYVCGCELIEALGHLTQVSFLNVILAQRNAKVKPGPKMQLRSLYIGQHFMHYSDAAALPDGNVTLLAETLHLLPHLQVLSLAGNGISCQGATMLAAELHSLPRLQELHLHNNRIADAGHKALAAALPALPLLTTLTMHNNDTEGDPSGPQALAGVLARHQPRLTKLSLGHVVAGLGDDPATTASLASLTQLSALTLRFYSNAMGRVPDGVALVQLARSLVHLRHLRSLDVNFCYVTSASRGRTLRKSPDSSQSLLDNSLPRLAFRADWQVFTAILSL